MPVQTVLQHCVEIRVYPVQPGDPPLTGPVTVTAGGATGDGSVVVTTVPPGGATPVLTGGAPKTIGGPGTTEVWMHYHADPGKPQQVPVTMT
jgi:hypothetical protein